jgi:hypothetical protein
VDTTQTQTQGEDCPICMELPSRPVTLDCNHAFCEVRVRLCLYASMPVCQYAALCPVLCCPLLPCAV